MNLIRLLILIAIGWLIYQLFIRRWLSSRSVQQQPPRQVQSARCAHCGMHIPVADAVVRNGQTFCSAEHALRGPR